MAIFLTLTATSAPLGASLIYDRFDSYQPVLWLVLMLAVSAVGVMMLARTTTVKSTLVEGIESVITVPESAAS
jgi:hypothetical protein